METKSWELYEDILKRYNPKITGKILQGILGLSFYYVFDCSPTDITINFVEGVDIIIEQQNLRYAIEVKSTKINEVNFKQKDLDGLERYSKIGYKSLIAILNIDLHSDWIFVNKERIKRKLRWQVCELYTDDEFKERGNDINNKFNELSSQHGFQIKTQGLNYVLSLLKTNGIRYSGD